MTDKQDAVRGAPFVVEIAVNGYVVKDVHGYVWCTCRNKEYADTIKNGLHALAREWKP